MKMKNVIALAGGFLVGAGAAGAGYVVGKAVGYKTAMDEVQAMNRVDEAMNDLEVEITEVVIEEDDEKESITEQEILDKEIEEEDNEIEQELENK